MSENARPSVVVVGGGYAGFKVAKLLDDVADVTLVDKTDTFMHNVAAWRALVEPEWLERIFLPYRRLLARGRFVQDSVVEADGRRVRLASGQVLEPDYLVLATGSSYPFPAKIDEPDVGSARARARAAHEALAGSERVLLLGAGPAGLELAGEIKTTFPGKHVILADAASDILQGPFDDELRVELRKQLADLGVELRLGAALRGLPSVPPAVAGPVSVVTEAGEELTADVWFRCFGVVPRTDYLRGSLAAARDERGYVRVDERLRVAGHERVFAVGDIADADRKMAGFAGAQGELLAANLRALITGEGEQQDYERRPPVILVPLGPEGGAGYLPDYGGFVGREVTSQIKGQAMLLDMYTGHFDA
ncbi:NAD(P)/FAD-dependent oxidoreductase [Nonomuraea aridisoli]|uniref:FAD-dependent oxidoreductase n=1 Tax=Nonomuraea aridisoli TaxID=2070368 RepID=A0A2W2E808_9ACTN|nr:FAD-dependent oxidoreductase [Nonomuraea aridisoli]PZG20242.1 FAD-dependent oxidoreductase [Nonomuraea aridisoli]